MCNGGGGGTKLGAYSDNGRIGIIQIKEPLFYKCFIVINRLKMDYILKHTRIK